MKNKPKSIEEFVFQTITAPPPPPPRPVKMAARGPWANMTPEERKAYSQKLIAARKGNHPNKPIPGKPAKLTNAQWAEVQEAARLDTKRIMKKIKEAGQLPDDPMAVEALEKTVKTLRECGRSLGLPRDDGRGQLPERGASVGGRECRSLL
ncbi:hypothetical protein H5V43_06895 [Sphingobium fuliginis]|uniref:Uncharacterized protein n=1 Tax=Sphingobium fuliginis (strain ATCC 27551) TaxID=336203 RepID=A0A7M2GJX9_SPHSA|nr:hypothetical protein [Sphingobium fuliginis]QOT72833.1 hypothetical protein H5V43_06895 [Sphingobium fuliginis]